MLEAVHLGWACHPVWPSNRVDAGSCGGSLAVASWPEGRGVLSRQLPTQPLPAAPVPLDYCGRNRRFDLWRFLHSEPLLERLHVAPRNTDQASAALIMDLKQRGLLDDTLVIWGGEFGRTSYSQGEIKKDSFGRDHHPRCFSIWMAGGGIKPGITYGATDEFAYNITENPVHVHDFHATMMHLLGVSHTRLTHRFEGRDYRLTDIAGQIVSGILA